MEEISASIRNGAEERLPRKIGGKYRPIRVLGRGGMSTVYEVEHSITRDLLALKVLKRPLDPVGTARFKREARMPALMKSAHIVRVIDADVAPELNGAPFLVMDLLRGADLATFSAKCPQPRDDVVDWLRQAGRAIDLAHSFGVVHRDLKPENLFLTQTDDAKPLIKVLDFGVARISATDEPTGTKSGSLVGTPLFMAPEQASGAAVGTSADIWSIGMCAFRLLGGRDYWDAENIALLLAKIVYEPVLPPSRRGLDLGAEFDDWFLRSCARNPTERWESVGRQIEELARALECPVHSLTVLEPSSHNPIARIDDRTISRVDERNRGVDSLDATATSADVVRSSRIGVIRLALAAASVLAVSTVLYSRIFSSREHEAFHAPTQSLKTPVSPAEIPTRDAPKPASAELPESSDRAVTASSLPIDTKLPLLPRPVVSSVRRRPVLPSLQREATPSPSTAPAVPSSAPLSPSSPRDPLADPD